MRHSRAQSHVSKLHQLVAKAVRIVGSQTALAKQIGKTPQLVSFLATRATKISPEDAIGIHRATRGQVPASLLRPDLWRRPDHVPVDEPVE
jgi:DNA-binding transcriptional regulator YdaS (Cro superfamily)